MPGGGSFFIRSIISGNCALSYFWFPPPSSLLIQAGSKRASSVISPLGSGTHSLFGTSRHFYDDDYSGTGIICARSRVLCRGSAASPRTPSGVTQPVPPPHPLTGMWSAASPIRSATPRPSSGLATPVRNRFSLDSVEQLPPTFAKPPPLHRPRLFFVRRSHLLPQTHPPVHNHFQTSHGLSHLP